MQQTFFQFTCSARLSTIPHTSTCLQCQKNNSILWEKDLKNVLTSCKLSSLWSHTIALCKKDDFLRRFVRVFCCQLRTAWMVLSRVFLFYLHNVFLLLLNSKVTWVRVSFSYKSVLKVSWFQNVLLLSLFRPKNQRNIFKDFGPSL